MPDRDGDRDGDRDDRARLRYYPQGFRALKGAISMG